MKIEPLNLEILDNLKHFLDWQEYLKSKFDNGFLGIPIQHYCESSKEKCDKQCRYCKDE
jgi:hypothetical protein